MNERKEDWAASQTTSQIASDSAFVVRVGEKIGRFSILSEVGSGGMGRIFEVYDPNLDRRIALKLLHESGESEHRQRLVREAKALARLDHPHVVTVHDVGTHEGQLFVAMELVRGGTLKAWLKRNPGGEHGRQQAAAGLLIGAGRGLVAAHEAGLVHRDVKPSNILIGEDGRARVADFGIAQLLTSEESRSGAPGPESYDALLTSTDDSGSGPTRTGTSIGTPAYMAPEQLGRAPVDAAADQFSFCVTAWELLFGVRPFPGGEPRERLAAIRAGSLIRPEEIEVADEIEALLRRGLRLRPSDRHRRLADLIDALSQSVATDAGSGRRSLRHWAVVVVGIGAMSAGVAYGVAQTERRCEGAAASWDAVWADGRREKVRGALLRSGLDFAPGAWRRLEDGLDSYGDVWRRSHTEWCEATRVRGEQSMERMEERLGCLEGTLHSVDALLTLVSSGRPDVIANEQKLLEGLPRVDDCAEARGLPSPAELPAMRAVAQARMKRSAGRSREALQIVEPFSHGLTPGTTPIVRAQVLLEYGRSLSMASNPRRALKPLSEAYAVARATDLGSLSSAVARELTRVYGMLREEPATIRTWLKRANSEGAARSTSESVELLTLEGVLLRLEGDGESAVRAFERAVESAKMDPTLLPHARRRLSEELVKKRHGGDKLAVDLGRKALQEYREQFGEDHPGVAVFESNLARGLARAGEAEEAFELAQRALGRATATWGKGDYATSSYLVGLSSVQCELYGDTEEGLRLAREALSLHGEAEETRARFAALSAVARCALLRDDQFAKESWDLVELSKRLYGEQHQTTVLSQARYAQALLRAPHPENEGLWELLLLTTALADEKVPGWDVYVAVDIHGILGTVAEQVGGGAMALAQAETARRLLDTAASPPAGLEGMVHRNLCMAKWDVGRREAAFAECVRAVELLSLDHEPRRLASAEHNLGVMFQMSGRDSDALPYLEKAVRRFTTLGMEEWGALDLAKSHWRLGLARERLRRYSDAERSYRASFELYGDSKRAERVDAGAGIVRMVARAGRFGEAYELLDGLKTSSSVDDPFHQARISEALGFVLHQQNPRRGKREYSKAFEFFRTTGRTRHLERLCREAPFKLRGCESSTASSAEPGAGALPRK